MSRRASRELRIVVRWLDGRARIRAEVVRIRTGDPTVRQGIALTNWQNSGGMSWIASCKIWTP